ncbi:DUF418 domain-containing protein [Alteribacter populi]|uniref:DUF418 domain-containing protein n=1 Tax=Alteribacter populi TaxID=2011011 RepID=UPI000BBB41D9|nr:DUF418 domain-containing protein [Alteribacter populi]
MGYDQSSGNERITPVQPGERLSHLDSLRGFALFGILLVNSLYFQYGMFGFKNFEPVFGATESGTTSMIQLFFEGSFYPLFSMLFGFGAVLIWQRLQERGQSFGGLYFRRMLILIFLGIIHTYFIWDGDILLSYGICGLFLLLFIKRKPKTILAWVLGLAIFLVLPSLMPDDGSADDMTFTNIKEQEISALSEGSYLDVVVHRLTADPFQDVEFGIIYTITMSFVMGLQIIMLFLLGAYLAKKGWIHRPEESKKPLLIMTLVFGTIGLITKAGDVFTNQYQLEYFSMILGGPMLTLGYIGAFMLLFQAGILEKLFRGFGYVGRMALTNYLSQSIIMTTLYYGYGFGLFGEVGIPIGVLIVLGVFILQIFISRWWLKHFQYGPVEWFWRVGTYMRSQSLKRKKDPA